jgi:hypothetical protein
MLTDGTVIRAYGAPLPGHVLSTGDGRWGGPHHLRLPSHWAGMETDVCDPGQRTGKTPGDAKSPGETPGHPGVPRGEPRETTAPAHGAGPCLADGCHLRAGALHKVPYSHLMR